MRCKVLFVLVFLIDVFIPSFAGRCWAQGNMKIGILNVHTFLNLKQLRNDNIYLEPRAEKNRDWISVVSPGISFVTRKEILGLNYNADILRYADLTKENRVDHNLLSQLNLGDPEKLSLTLQNKFKNTADPPDSEKTNKEKRIRNDFSSGFAYDLNRLAFNVGYLNARDDYKSENLHLLDKYEHIFTLIGAFKILPKTSLFFENNYGLIKYDLSVLSNSWYDQPRLGLEGAVTSKLTALIKLGYQTRNYQKVEIKNFNGLTSFASLTHKVSAQTGINFFGERAVEESSYTSMNYYVLNKLGLQLNQKIKNLVSVTADTAVQKNNYPRETTEGSKTAKRQDNFFSATVRIQYQTKGWLSPSLQYEYKRRNSNFDRFDYTDNITMLMLAAFF